MFSCITCIKTCITSRKEKENVLCLGAAMGRSAQTSRDVGGTDASPRRWTLPAAPEANTCCPAKAADAARLCGVSTAQERAFWGCERGKYYIKTAPLCFVSETGSLHAGQGDRVLHFTGDGESQHHDGKAARRRIRRERCRRRDTATQRRQRV